MRWKVELSELMKSSPRLTVITATVFLQNGAIAVPSIAAPHLVMAIMAKWPISESILAHAKRFDSIFLD